MAHKEKLCHLGDVEYHGHYVDRHYSAEQDIAFLLQEWQQKVQNNDFDIHGTVQTAKMSKYWNLDHPIQIEGGSLDDVTPKIYIIHAKYYHLYKAEPVLKHK